MPAKNTVKIYVQDGIYHVYNRGVEKRKIFLDERDYKVFLRFLKDALEAPPDPKNKIKNVTFKGQTFKGVPRASKNFHQKIELLAYCLMPNHFHLLLRQHDGRDMNKFMQSLITRYSIYFNKTHKRSGALFQGRYKASLVLDEPYLIHLTRYIHLNPKAQSALLLSAYSSYGEYLGVRKTNWIHTDFILSFFRSDLMPINKPFTSYQQFVEQNGENILTEKELEEFMLTNTL